MQKEILQIKKWLPLAIFLLILGIPILAVTRYHDFLYQKMNEYKLLPMDEPFTELYFEKPQQLPANVQPYKPFGFAFTVHNLEGRDMQYPYSVYFVKDTGARIDIATGTLFIPNAALVTTKVITTFVRSPTGTMTVELLGRQQSIDFLTNNF